MKQQFIISARGSFDEEMTPIAILTQNSIDNVTMAVTDFLNLLGYERSDDPEWFDTVIDDVWWNDVYDGTKDDSGIRIVLTIANVY